MRRRRKISAIYLVPIVVFVTWTVFIYQFSPSDIVAFIGTDHVYLATFLLSFIGGFSVFVSIPYHLVLMTFAAGGVNPWLLGLVCSIGQCCGDSSSYLLGFSGRNVAPGRIAAMMDRFRRWCTERPYWQMAGALTIYGSISPLSNDWILVPMGLARYPYWRVMLPLELGNLVFNTSMALLGAYGLASVLG
ncbi:MAG: hypothetical protein WCS85_02210 [Candidatus Peribacteraceae bacterium]